MSEIITAGNPILKAVAAPVTSFDKKLKFLILDMKKTLYEANGVGLAAPQIAVSKRIFVADDGESGFEAYINPEWQPDGDEMATDSEGCLSVPGLFGEVTRYARVIVRYQDIHGKKKVKKASGLLARCIQHETDHLNGILFIEKSISSSFLRVDSNKASLLSEYKKLCDIYKIKYFENLNEIERFIDIRKLTCLL